MTTEAITTRPAGVESSAATATRPATSRVADEQFAALLSHAADRSTESNPPTDPVAAAPSSTNQTQSGDEADAGPSPCSCATRHSPAPAAPIPAATTAGGITPGTIGALLAAAGGSGADLVAGAIAQLIGSSPDPSQRLPFTSGATTDLDLTGDMDQRRRTLEPLFEAAGARYGVDPALLAAVAWTESAFQPDVVSHAGAIGLMQIMPGTAAGLGVDPRDPAQAIDGAARYLRDALDQFGDVRLALAAYNAGPGAVASHGGIPPYPETTAYVVKVMDRYESLRGAST